VSRFSATAGGIIAGQAEVHTGMSKRKRYVVRQEQALLGGHKDGNRLSL
jgi:hypothetical protein